MYRFLAVVGIGFVVFGGVAQAITVDGNIGNGEWGSWGTSTDPNAYVFNANPGVDFQSVWDQQNNHHAPAIRRGGGPWDGPTMDAGSGGEWFDIEGLYLNFATAGTQTTLSWAIVTSDPGLAPDEWNTNLDPNDVVNGRGTYAGVRNANSLHRNPVIGLNLDGVGASEYALVLDDMGTNVLGQHWGTGSLGSQSAPLAATLYCDLTSGDWLQGTDFLHSVDIRMTADLVANHVAGTGSTVRGMAPNNETTQMGAGYWHMPYNYVWEGSMVVSDLIGVAPNATASYGMYCGNDYVVDHPTPTPELSTWALLGCSLLGLFGTGWRRRRAA